VALGWRVVDFAVALRRAVANEKLSRLGPYLLLVPSILIVSLLAAGLVDLFWRSIHSFDPFLRQEGPVSLDQYRRLFTGPEGDHYSAVLTRTLMLSAAVTVSAVAIATPVAYYIMRVSRRWQRLLALALVLVPFLMGEVVRAFGWLLLLGRNGVVAWIGSLVGTEDVSLIGTKTGIWIGMLQVMVPIATLVLLPSIRRIDPDLERAAQTLGARPMHVWRHVVLPLARSGMVAASIVVFSLSMTEFAIPQVLGLGRQPFVANAIHSMYFLQNNVYFGSAFAIMLLVIVTVVVLILSRLGRASNREVGA